MAIIDHKCSILRCARLAISGDREKEESSMRQIVLIIFLTFFLILAFIAVDPLDAENPSITDRIYWPGMWRDAENWGRFKLGWWINDSFLTRWTV